MSTAINTVQQTQTTSLFKAAQSGAIAGLAGGLVFGMLMAMMGMLPMVALLVGSHSTVVGGIIHLIISAIIGVTYGLVAGYLPSNFITVTLAGTGYGIVWWVLGALVLMPLMLGMPQMVLAIGGPQWMSLMGHIIFGVSTGIVFNFLNKRS